MKGIIWKSLGKFAVVLTSLFAICVISLASIDSASAASVPLSSGSGTYGYFINGSYGRGISWSGSFPRELLTGGSSVSKYLYGVQMDFSFGNGFSGSYYTNIAKTTMRIYQQYSYEKSINDGIGAEVSGVSHNGSSLSGTCEVTASTNNYTDWTCTLSVSNYDYPISASMTIGRSASFTHNSDPYLALTQIAPSNNNSVYLQSASYELDSSQDPNTAILNQQLAEQQQTNELLEQQAQQDQQDRSGVQDASDSADSNADAAQSQNEGATSNLLNLMGSFVEALQTPATNCRVPADLGNLDLGTIDFCTGKPAEFVPIINTISALVMSFAIYLVARHLIHSFIRITVFAQGGKE